MMRNSRAGRRSLWNKFTFTLCLSLAAWQGTNVRAEINVTGPGNRGSINVQPKKGGVLPSLLDRNRPFRSRGTFQTLNAEPSDGTQSFPGGMIHPDPDDPSTKVFLSVTPANVTVVAGQSATLTITATFVGTPPETVRTYHGPVPSGLGITAAGSVHTLTTSRRTRTFTVSTTTSVPPTSYQFYVSGLTSENKYTQPAPYTLTVQAPPAPPANTSTNTGVVTIVNTEVSVFTPGTYNLNGALQQVGALFDNENDHIVNSMPAGTNSVPFPRFPRLFGLGNWTIDVGRGYPGNGPLTANVVVTAFLNGQRFIAAHLHVSNTGLVTPVLLIAGDLNNPGVVMSTNEFQVAVEGATPTATSNGFIRGVVEGVPMFLSPDATVLWADGVTFAFDVPLLND